MKTKSHRLFALGAGVVNLIAAQIVSSQTERFSASLSGGNDVPPINSAGTGNFQMTIRPDAINFSLSFADLSSPLSVAHLHSHPAKSLVA